MPEQLEPIDIPRMVDLGTTQPGEEQGQDLLALTMYNQLIANGDYAGAARYVAPGGAGQILYTRLFDAGKWNLIVDKIKETQEFFNSNVEEYIHAVEASVDSTAIVDAATTYSGSININASTFIQATGAEASTYTITCTASNIWSLNGAVINLADYGISITSSPIVGDVIVITIESVGGRIDDTAASENNIYSSAKIEELMSAYANRVRLINNSGSILTSISYTDFRNNQFIINNTTLAEWANDNNFYVTSNDEITINMSQDSQQIAGGAGLGCESTNDGITLFIDRAFDGQIKIESIKVVKP